MGNVFQSMLEGIASTGMNTTEIASQAGLSRQTLYRIKNGEAQQPSHETYTKLDRVYRTAVPPPARQLVQKSRA